MGFATEMLIAFGRLASSRLAGDAKAVLVNMRLLEDTDEDDEPETSTDEPMYGQLGCYARPRPPVSAAEATGVDPQGGAEVIGVRVSDRVFPLGYRDLRLTVNVNPKPGEVGLVGYGGGFISLTDHADLLGTNIMLYSLRRKSDGTADKASCISIDSTAANAHVCLMHEFGHSLTLTPDGDTIIADKSGANFLQVAEKTPQIVLNAEVCALNAAVMLGDKDPAGGDEVMLSTALLAWVAEVNTALGVIALAAGNPNVPAIVAPASVPLAATKVKGI